MRADVKLIELDGGKSKNNPMMETLSQLLKPKQCLDKFVKDYQGHWNRQKMLQIKKSLDFDSVGEHHWMASKHHILTPTQINKMISLQPQPSARLRLPPLTSECNDSRLNEGVDFNSARNDGQKVRNAFYVQDFAKLERIERKKKDLTVVHNRDKTAKKDKNTNKCMHHKFKHKSEKSNISSDRNQIVFDIFTDVLLEHNSTSNLEYAQSHSKISDIIIEATDISNQVTDYKEATALEMDLPTIEKLEDGAPEPFQPLIITENINVDSNSVSNLLPLKDVITINLPNLQTEEATSTSQLQISYSMESVANESSIPIEKSSNENLISPISNGISSFLVASNHRHSMRRSSSVYNKNMNLVDKKNSNSNLKKKRIISGLGVEIYVPEPWNPICFRWKFAIQQVIRSLRLKSIPKLTTKNVADELDIRGHMVEDNHFYSRVKVKELVSIMAFLSKAPNEPTMEIDMTTISFEDTFTFIPYLMSQKQSVRLHIAAFGRIEVHPKGKMIVREKTKCTTLYIIIDGLCIEHVSSANEEFPVKLHRIGDCIGETSGNAVPIRQFSATTLCRTTFLCIEKREWLTAMKKGNTEAQKIELISNLTPFMNLPISIIEEFATKGSITKLSSDEKVISPQDENTSFFLICKGSCKIQLRIPFLKVAKNELDDDSVIPSEYQVIPFYGQKLNPIRDELVYVPHDLDILGPGDVFPPHIRGLYKLYTIITSEPTDLVEFSLSTAKESLPPCIHEYLTTREEGIYLSDTQVRELQEQYLSTRGWRNDSDSLLNKMLCEETDRDRWEMIQARYFT
ncbi:hypothetical protein BC833DRAFT_617097 [Globomyces pollinis-pini]|nr:hypothetical protein BC833DRAFT_617097 [Globomyces pollinis-pini]